MDKHVEISGLPLSTRKREHGWVLGARRGAAAMGQHHGRPGGGTGAAAVVPKVHGVVPARCALGLLTLVAASEGSRRLILVCEHRSKTALSFGLSECWHSSRCCSFRAACLCSPSVMWCCNPARLNHLSWAPGPAAGSAPLERSSPRPEDNEGHTSMP